MTTISGKIVSTESGQGIDGLVVAVFALPDSFLNALSPADLPDLDFILGSNATSGGGMFSISTSVSPLPNLELSVFSPFKRVIFSAAQAKPAGDFTWPTISLTQSQVQGWLATQGTNSPVRLSQNNQVQLFDDNAVAWGALVDAVENASVGIELIQYYWNFGQTFERFVPPIPPVGQPTKADRLEVKLLVKNAAGLPVKILMHESIIPFTTTGMPYPASSGKLVKDILAGLNPPNTIEVRLLPRLLPIPLHAKLLIVDDQAFLIGSPFIQDFCNGSDHAIDDPRRGPLTWPVNDINMPIHDTNLVIKGPAVGAIKESFRTLWNSVGNPIPPWPTPGPAPQPNAALQIVQTIPRLLLPSVPGGETSVLEVYQRAIENAQVLIYLENQYFVDKWLFDTLLLRLEHTNNLQAILVATHPDVSVLFPLQRALLSNSRFKKLKDAGRFGVFMLWSHESDSNGTRIIRNYVHSKAAVIDDTWATVGSANLDGVSLSRVQARYLDTRLATWKEAYVKDLIPENNRRAVEMNAIIYNGVAGLPVSTVPDDFRRQLWAEHLGYDDPNSPDLKQAPPGGWLQLWNTKAKQKLDGLTQSPTTPVKARVLQWVPEPDPKKYLKGLGVDTAKLKVIKECRAFDFTTGQWK
jgi:phosphatidylserine/phosphatidylglycerophosphate/cardiolipin synthase-like enzyme